jgi:iron complex outermembrane recepter protein
MSKNKPPKMAFTRKPCVIATGIAISLMAAQSYAQTPAPAPAAATEKVEKIEVTGSRIPSANLESTSPITTIDAAAIKIDGLRSTESLLNNLPQVFADQGGTVVNGATGTAAVNLRGLGSSRSLVLVNGRRLPYGSANTTAADLNQIPAGLIKRIEVLTGGAGAVYGSNAVAGVVNFIMNDKFEGVQLDFNTSFYNHQQQNAGGVADIVGTRGQTNSAQFQVPGDKSADGKVYDASILLGGNFANGKGNATAYFAYKKEDALLQSERDFSACALGANARGFTCGGSGTNATGTITNLTTNVAYTNTANGGSRRLDPNQDLYNFGPLNFYQRPSERYNAAVFANYEILPAAKVYTEFMFNDYRSVAQIAPGGAFGTVTTVTFDNPLLSQAWRTNLGLLAAGDTADIVVQRRNVEGGGRQSDFRNTSFRTQVGVKGEFATNWTYDAFMQTSKVIYQQQEQNYFSSARLANALDVVNVNGQAVCRVAQAGTDTACVPYNVFALGGVTPAQLAYLQIPGLRTGSAQQTIQGASIGADLDAYGVRLPTAKNGVGVSFGFERRIDKLDLNTDAATQSGDLSGSGGPTPGLSGKTEVKEFFTELRAPLIEGKAFADLLQINASYRNSDYSGGTKTNTFGFGIEWAPIKAFKTRATYQKAVRAPDVIDLFTARGLNLYDNDADPCAGEVVNGRANGGDGATLAQCQRTGVTAAQFGLIADSPAGQYNFLQGGNPNLSPEKAKSYTVGFVFAPTANLNASIDYFDIKINDTISNVNPVTTLNNCIDSGDPRFCSQITRDRLGTLWLLNEAQIIGTNVNIGSTRTSGFDVAFNYNMKFGNGYGGLMFSTVGTYLRSLNTEEIKDLGSYECVGLYGNTCGTPNPRVRNKARVTWNSPFNVDLSFTWRYFKKVDIDTTSGNPLLSGVALPVERTLGDRNYFDLAATWNATKMITVAAGINNLLDKDPPLSSKVGVGVGNGNTYPGVYDALGRRIFVNATVKF